MARTRTLSVISAFEVPPDADEAFVAGWERARDLLAGKDPAGSTALHRALRSDVTLRFVDVARPGSQDAVGDPGAALPFTAHAGVYEVIQEDGEPEGAGGVLLIDAVEVPADEDERFLADRERIRAVFAARRGYLGTRLHRSLGTARFRFVEVVRWSSPLMYARALRQPEVGQAASARRFAGRPALYLLIQTRTHSNVGA